MYSKLKLLCVFFAAKDLVECLKQGKEPNEAINRLIRAVESDDVKGEEGND